MTHISKVISKLRDTITDSKDYTFVYGSKNYYIFKCKSGCYASFNSIDYNILGVTYFKSYADVKKVLEILKDYNDKTK